MLVSPDLNIGTTLAIFNSMGNIPDEKDLFIKYVNGSIKLLTHCLAIDVGMSSHPGLEFCNDCIICKTSLGDTSDITILFGILLTNDKGLILDVIFLANLSPIETKKSLNSLAITTLSDMQPLSVIKVTCTFRCLALQFLPIMSLSTFQH